MEVENAWKVNGRKKVQGIGSLFLILIVYGLQKKADPSICTV